MPGAREAARAALARALRVAALTGAGVSAASGVPTFRGPGGLWRGRRPEELATPAAWARDPEEVWAWYRSRFEALRAAAPNDAHRSLAALARRTRLTLVTQNVDGLHRRAGSEAVIELHGDITRALCERCGARWGLEPGFAIPPRCGRCGGRGRPNAVWFGEALPRDGLERAAEAFAACEVALVVGTSALVEPAASLGRLAARAGAYVIEINPEPTPLTAFADASLRCGAVEGLRSLLPEDDRA